MGTPERVRALVLDIDGVVWRDYQPIPGAVDMVDYARKKGVAVCFLTNNSSQSRGFLLDRLNEIGLDVRMDSVYSAASIAAAYLAREQFAGIRCLTLEEDAVLLDELRLLGLAAMPLDQYAVSGEELEACVVVAGHYPGFGYADVSRLLEISAWVQGAFTIDRDRWHSTKGQPRPSSGGWVVAAIEEILDSKVITLGKPNEIALQTVADRLSVDVGAILMVGDSLRADIAAAANAGAVSCHFDDPGISSSYRALNDGPTPNHVVRDLGEVRTLLDRLT